MKLYWAKAIVEENGKEREQWTYDGSLTMDKTIKCVRVWNEMFWVKQAWVVIQDLDNHSETRVELNWNHIR